MKMPGILPKGSRNSILIGFNTPKGSGVKAYYVTPYEL